MAKKKPDHELPSVVRIGPFDFAVSMINGFREDDKKLDGSIRFTDSTIVIEASLGAQAAYHTVWHEIVHGFFTAAGVHDLEDKEQIIEIVTSGIMQVLRDNSMLRKPPNG